METTNPQKKPRLHPRRLTKDTALLERVAVLESLCFTSPWSAQSLELLTHDGIGVAYLLDDPADPTRVAAYGGMLITVDEGQIINIATHPDHRRKGYAAAILRALLRHAKDAHLESVSLEVRVSNEAAIAMYRAAGFVEAGRRKGFYTKPVEDALVMVCKIK